MTFKVGESGNPAGRPKGARNKTTLAIEALLDDEAEELTRKVIAKAKEGDMTALKLCLDRIAPMPLIGCATAHASPWTHVS